MLRELQVLHRAEAIVELPEALVAAGTEGRAFVVHTCQRVVVVCIGRDHHQGLASQLGDWHAEHYEGPHAYAFLLRLACGLESRLTGETEVFGQLKQAWAEFAERGSEQAQQLAGFMQSLFRDVKDVRSRFLSNIGSASYGSLVRRLLDQPGESGPVLLVGAGSLAESVAPWLRGTALWIWNRNHERATALANSLRSRDGARQIHVLDSTVEAELAAWRAARDVVVCVPADAQRDAARAAAWATPRANRGQLVHLGVDDTADLSNWSAAGKLLNLTAVYELLQAQNELRQAQVRRAERACRERSLLRSLGRSDSEPHGWEDLVAIDSLCS